MPIEGSGVHPSGSPSPAAPLVVLHSRYSSPTRASQVVWRHALCARTITRASCLLRSNTQAHANDKKWHHSASPPSPRSNSPASASRLRPRPSAM
eukprot:13868235-Heterocapsa_arctica.AAC.1